jgi:hypothetical protein
MSRLRAMFVLTACLIARSGAADDRFDVGLLLGATTASNEGAVLQFDRALAYQATFGWRFWEGDRVALSVEVLFLASPAFTVTNPDGSLPKEYASLYLTPGVRATLPIRGPLSAFGSLGAGYARYSESKLRRDGTSNPGQQDTNAAALQFGGGITCEAGPGSDFAARSAMSTPARANSRLSHRAGPFTIW